MTRGADAMLRVHEVVRANISVSSAAGAAARAIYAARLVRESIIEPILSKIGERALQRSS